MSLSDTFEADLLALIYQNVGIANVGDAVGLRPSSAAGSLYAAGHSADPGEGGIQTTFELTYTGYARASVARSAAQWSVVSVGGVGTVSNVNPIVWPKLTANPTTLAWVSVGTAASGAGKILARYQVITPSGGQQLPINAIPTIAAGLLQLTAT